ncbi:unnamed protein product [Adineta ricciae]|nr:unnamed protein product [Adineta ricciae]
MKTISNVRPIADKILRDISSYVHNYKIQSSLAFDTARLCFLDTLGCALEALKYPQCTRLIGPVVPGATIPNGARVLGTNHILDPVRAAFSIGTQIRWLDYNDCWLAAEWGHPSDNLGGILAVTDYLTRTAKYFSSLNQQNAKIFKVHDVLEAMIKAHEIQGVLALENSFNRVGLDHVVLVKVATTAVVCRLLGLTESQTVDALSHAWIDGQSLRTYRHAPNTMSRKSWAAGDACMRAVHLALLVEKGESGISSALTEKTWGFYDVCFQGKEFKLQRDFGSYVMENILFKISFPAEFHAQTAAEAALICHNLLKEKGFTAPQDIKSVRIRTQQAAMRIIDKSGPLYNFADRDHCIQYIVAIPLIYGRLTTNDYTDVVASDPRIDEMRTKMICIEDQRFTQEYYDPNKRYIGNAIQITLNDGTELDEIEINYPIGHRKRREEGEILLMDKFQRHLRGKFDEKRVEKILNQSQAGFESTDIDDYINLYV